LFCPIFIALGNTSGKHPREEGRIMFTARASIRAALTTFMFATKVLQLFVSDNTLATNRTDPLGTAQSVYLFCKSRT